METVKKRVTLLPKAEDTIFAVFDYVAEKGYPETGARLFERMYAFAFTLGDFAEKFPLCRFAGIISNGSRCAVFESNYIFVYSVLPDEVAVTDIIHVKRLR